MAAAVGSLIILATLSPAIIPASFVACLWASLKYAVDHKSQITKISKLIQNYQDMVGIKHVIFQTEVYQGR